MGRVYWFYHSLDRYFGIPLCLLLSVADKLFFRRTREKKHFDRILIIKLGMVGDTILLMPVLRALKEKYPNSHITMVCISATKEIVEDWNFVDRILVFDLPRFLKHPLDFVRFMLGLIKRRADLAIDFGQWTRLEPLLAYLSGAKIRIGFRTAKQFRHYLYTSYVKHRKGRHEIECFADLVSILGVKVKNISFGIRAKKEEKKRVGNLLDANGVYDGERFVVIHPGCGPYGYYRQWPEEKYAQLADVIMEKGQRKVVLTGSKSEKEIVRKIISLMQNLPVDFTGRLTLRELIALVEKSSLVVCGNTGIMHLAVAIGVPVVALHGPTDPKKWGPWGEGNIVIRKNLPCSPCLYLGFEYGCKEKICMKSITVEEVIQAVENKSN